MQRICPKCRAQFPEGSNFCPFDGQRLEAFDAAAPEQDPFLGQVLDERYRIESRLGSGGMGDVYAARHVVIDKPCAIKILRRELCRDPRQYERFVREARAASRIGHPNIVDVTDFGRLDDDQVYFVMEFLDGVTLAQEMRDHGTLSSRRTLNLGVQICQALEAAHAKGIVHRDLKPENIFVVNPLTQASEDPGARQDCIKLLDFGIAKISWDNRGRRLTTAGSVFGTPQYMSPEQAAGAEADHRADIYALGCILYEMLTGEVPFLADTYLGTLTKQMFNSPVPPRDLRPDLGLAEPLEQLVLTALSKEPVERFQSARAMRLAMERCSELCEAGPVRRVDPDAPGPGRPTYAEAGVSTPEATPRAAAEPPVHLLMDGRSPATGRPAGVPARAAGVPARAVLAAVGLFVALTAGGTYLVLTSGDGRDGPDNGPVAAATAGGATADHGAATPPEVLGAGGTVASADASGGAAAAALDAGGQARASRAQPRRARRVPRLVVRSLPTAATVYLGQRKLGITPTTVRLPAGGPRRLLVRKAGYADSVVERRIARDDEVLVRLVPLARPPAAVRPTKTRYGSVDDLRNPFRRHRGGQKLVPPTAGNGSDPSE